MTRRFGCWTCGRRWFTVFMTAPDTECPFCGERGITWHVASP